MPSAWRWRRCWCCCRPILTPFIAAAILAYALNPGVDWLATRRLVGRFHVPRALAVLIVMLLLLAAILALVLIVVPVAAKGNPGCCRSKSRRCWKS